MHLFQKILTRLLIAIFPLLTFLGGYYLSQANAFDHSIHTYKGDIPLDVIEELNNIMKQRLFLTKDPDKEQMKHSLAQGFVKGFGDHHTIYMPPKESHDFEEAVKGEFSGIGAELTQEGEKILVVSPLKDSPAQKAGLLPRDQIIGVDGQMFKDNVDIQQAVDMIRGPKGSDVTLKVIRNKTHEVKEITITRDVIELRSLYTEYKGNGIYYAHIVQFDNNTASEFKDFINDAQENEKQPMNKLVLDLRNNPGGLMDQAVQIASKFVPIAKPVVSRKDKEGVVSLYSQGDGALKDMPIAILLNGGSASASEILAGALNYYTDAYIVGEQSYGKGTVQELVPLDEGATLKMTIAQWLLPSGENITGTGITPEKVVEFDPESIQDGGDDNQINAAIDYLKK